jgi:L-2-hydroxyglutarate oxidase LhgO
VSGSFTTHDTAECRRFEKDGSPKDRLVKPFDSAKKPWKKMGGGESNQMAYLMEQLLKLEKNIKSLRSTVRNVLLTRRVVIPTVTRIVGPVAREV